MSPEKVSAITLKLNNGATYTELQGIAARYIKKCFGEKHDTPSMRTRVASTFLRACVAYLRRDGAAEASGYRADASALEAALRVLRRDGRRYFDSLVAVADEIVVNSGRVEIRSRVAQRATEALEDMARRYREIAHEHRYAKNITIFYCVKNAFVNEGWPVPKPKEAYDLQAWLDGSAPELKLKIVKDLRDIRRRLK